VTATALFLHSTGTSPMMWASVPTEQLAGVEALMPSNLGYPPNPPMPRGAPFALADEVRHVLAQLPPEGPVHLIAHSYGALVGLTMLNELGPRLASVLFFEPVAFGALSRSTHADPAAVNDAKTFLQHPTFLRDETLGGGDEWLAAFIDYWNKPGSWARLPDPMKDFSREVGWKMFQEVRWVFQNTDDFERYVIKAPLTLLKGARSPVASRAMVDELARVNPHAVVQELACGHMGPLTHPPLFIEALLQHWARVQGTTKTTP
jgi:pimeloyl-ACP methyl ester carboxylesterase